jgi:hypothetical protein
MTGKIDMIPIYLFSTYEYISARKRYLPRIKDGVCEFKQINGDKTKASAFATDTFPSMKRAMGLYGVSLRRGEVPDKISRKAEALTEDTVKEVDKLAQAGNINDQLINIKNALNSYLTFSNLDDIDSTKCD